LTFEKLLIIGLIAVFLLGPERLPHYAGQLAKLVRNLRDMANGAKDRMRDELGADFDEVDWKKLDPRQYDPRRIIREALLDDESEPRITRPDSTEERTSEIDETPADGGESEADSSVGTTSVLATGAVPPYDTEAT
jgi:sec-independent protein translocase protein TatB